MNINEGVDVRTTTEDGRRKAEEGDISGGMCEPRTNTNLCCLAAVRSIGFQ